MGRSEQALPRALPAQAIPRFGQRLVLASCAAASASYRLAPSEQPLVLTPLDARRTLAILPGTGTAPSEEAIRFGDEGHSGFSFCAFRIDARRSGCVFTVDDRPSVFHLDRRIFRDGVCPRCGRVCELADATAAISVAAPGPDREDLIELPYRP